MISLLFKSGHNVLVKNNSVYFKYINIKLLNLLNPPVLINKSGSGILRKV